MFGSSFELYVRAESLIFLCTEDGLLNSTKTAVCPVRKNVRKTKDICMLIFFSSNSDFKMSTH